MYMHMQITCLFATIAFIKRQSPGSQCVLGDPRVGRSAACTITRRGCLGIHLGDLATGGTSGTSVRQIWAKVVH